jgi:putative transposase
MERLKQQHGRVTGRIKADNGGEFVSKALYKWAYDYQATLDFSKLGKPTETLILSRSTEVFGMIV